MADDLRYGTCWRWQSVRHMLGLGRCRLPDSALPALPPAFEIKRRMTYAGEGRDCPTWKAKEKNDGNQV